MDNFTQVFWELILLGILALIYFYYQKYRILRAHSWKIEDWHFLYEEALNTQNPENFQDLVHFLEDLEKIITSKKYPTLSWFDRWRHAQLPQEILEKFPESK